MANLKKGKKKAGYICYRRSVPENIISDAFTPEANPVCRPGGLITVI